MRPPYQIPGSQLARLIAKARKRFPAGITYCGQAKSWPECVRELYGTVELWYNDSAGGTHMETECSESESSEHDELCDCSSCRYNRELEKEERIRDERIDEELANE